MAGKCARANGFDRDRTGGPREENVNVCEDDHDFTSFDRTVPIVKNDLDSSPIRSLQFFLSPVVLYTSIRIDL